MQNVEIVMDGDIMTLRVDLSKDQGLTRNFKSIRIASTEGNLQLWKDGNPHPAGIRVNLNVFRQLAPSEQKKASILEGRRKGLW